MGEKKILQLFLRVWSSFEVKGFEMRGWILDKDQEQCILLEFKGDFLELKIVVRDFVILLDFQYIKVIIQVGGMVFLKSK